MILPDKLFFRIGEVADLLGVKPYVLRYWETEFPGLAPDKSKTGQRVYKKHEVETLLLIKQLLYTERYSIEGARRRLRELRKSGQLKSQRVIAAQAAQEAPQALEQVSSLQSAAPAESRVDSVLQPRLTQMIREHLLALRNLCHSH
jgi:DNA-binding transcriptional MerR regulator